MSDHWVYLIANETATAIKIGRCDSEHLIEKRLTALQTGNHERLTLIASLAPHDHPGEKDLHDRFRLYRMAGEWFRVEGPVLDWVMGKVDKDTATQLRRKIGASAIHQRNRCQTTSYHVELMLKALWNCGPYELAEEIAAYIRSAKWSVEEVGVIQQACERFLDHEYTRAFDDLRARERHARRLHAIYHGEDAA